LSSTAYEQTRNDITAAVPAIDLEEQHEDSSSSPRIDKDPHRKISIKKRSRKSSREISFSTKLLIFVLSFGSFVALWQFAAYLAGNSAILASPLTVLNALLSMLRLSPSPGTQGIQNAYFALFETLEVVALGLGLSVVVGVPIGVIMGRSRAIESIVEPWVTATNSIPVVVLIPGLYFTIGGGLPADVFISFVLSVFSVIINTHAGVKYMSNTLTEVGKTFGANEKQFVTQIVLPSALPDIFAGIRIAIGRALLGAVMAEALLGANHGLGGIMTTYEEILNTPAMMATVVLIALVGILLLQAPKLVEKRMFRWKEGERLARRIHQ
jgi:ABC-type nitrate/sulfonate/bicarbonate transport system permease component